jgi:zinc/manganese transport system substrate-binding protein
VLHILRDGRTARRGIAILVIAAVAITLTACSTATPGGAGSGSDSVIHVVAAENFWGSLAVQLGGSQVTVTSIITNPDADPHDYEPNASDARLISSARMTIINGVGYDPWATKLAATNAGAGRADLVVGDLVGAKDGDNPHRWYNPNNVRTVLDQITADYKKIDPANAVYFDRLHETVINTGLKTYFATIAKIRDTYAGTPVGASESIFAMMAPALGLNLVTPPAFLKAISEGTDPTAQDKATIDAQISGKRIKVYVDNSQNVNPDVAAQVNAAKAVGIPVITMTETLTPPGAPFQDWQVAQLDNLVKALAQATGK